MGIYSEVTKEASHPQKSIARPEEMLFLETPREIPGKSPFNLSRNRTTEKMFNQNRVKLDIKEMVLEAGGFQRKAN